MITDRRTATADNAEAVAVYLETHDTPFTDHVVVSDALDPRVALIVRDDRDVIVAVDFWPDMVFPRDLYVDHLPA